MKKIIILDNKSTNVYVFSYDEKIWKDGDHFIASEQHELQFKHTECNWMIVETLNIIIV